MEKNEDYKMKKEGDRVSTVRKALSAGGDYIQTTLKWQVQEMMHSIQSTNGMMLEDVFIVSPGKNSNAAAAATKSNASKKSNTGTKSSATNVASTANILQDTQKKGASPQTGIAAGEISLLPMNNVSLFSMPFVSPESLSHNVWDTDIYTGAPIMPSLNPTLLTMLQMQQMQLWQQMQQMQQMQQFQMYPFIAAQYAQSPAVPSHATGS